MYNALYKDRAVKVYHVLHYDFTCTRTCLSPFYFYSKQQLCQLYISYDSEYYITIQMHIFIIYTNKIPRISKYIIYLYEYIHCCKTPHSLSVLLEYAQILCHYMYASILQKSRLLPIIHTTIQLILI